jgi:hypothetical protein
MQLHFPINPSQFPPGLLIVCDFLQQKRFDSPHKTRILVLHRDSLADPNLVLRARQSPQSAALVWL